MTLLPFLLSVQSGDWDLRRTMAAGDKAAYLMLPPETVCGAQVIQMIWSPDGRSLVLGRLTTDVSPSQAAALVLQPSSNPPHQNNAVVVWNLATRTAKTVFSAPVALTRIDDIQTMPGSDRLVIEVTETTRGLNGAPDRRSNGALMVSTGTGATTRLSAGSPDDAFVEATYLSPRRPLGGLVRYEGRKASVRFFGPGGRLGPPVSLPGRTPLRFDAQGFPGYVGNTGVGLKGPMGFHRLDPTTGRLVSESPFPVPTRAKDGTLLISSAERAAMGLEPAEPATGLRTMALDSPAPSGARAPTVMLLVPGGKPEEGGIVSTDGVRPLLSPTKEAVAYLNQGSAMVRLLAPIPREAYDKALMEAAKREAVNKAKQIGTGILIYASDMDDVLPGQDVDLRRTLGPYLKNDRLLDGFTYTFRGGSVESVERPAETELGYVSGPGGRAVVYADGHARWVPDVP